MSAKAAFPKKVATTLVASQRCLLSRCEVLLVLAAETKACLTAKGAAVSILFPIHLLTVGAVEGTSKELGEREDGRKVVVM